jgi:hypothetical protein
MVLKSALELNLIETISDAGTNAFLSSSEIAGRMPTKNTDAGSTGPNATPLDELFRTQVLSRDQRERGG